MKKYQIIYADPPWKYEFANGYNRAIEKQYPTMSLDKIKSLQIPSDKNALLFLWATAPKLEEALQVMVAWDFIYRSCIIWDKELIGCGNYVRIQHEILLIRKSFPNETLIELFARKEDMLFDAHGFDGWDVWGNEVKSDIELSAE